ncbi:MAG: molecular chaperone HtpG [Candidatus Dasytiphilus stammeri]
MKKPEKYVFQSEVKQLLHLMIHSLYSNKEIFLRELISNASDAADKLRFSSLTNMDLYEGETDLHVRISINKENKTLTFDDNGIGMHRQEVIDQLGTIAKSGTKSFLKNLDSTKLLNTNNHLIGQFGVGFYSAFIVADKVTVRTRAAGASSESGVFWESQGEGDYIIGDIIKKNRGTEITLHLRKNENEFLDNDKLRTLIKKYSDHISIPVEMKSNHTSSELSDNIWEQVNRGQALWTRNKSDITEEEYKLFYKYITHDVNDPLIWSHNRIEGNQEYTTLLYIPSWVPQNIWSKDYKFGIKLYVKQVYIMDNVEQFIPNYLRFIRGLIDSTNLALNISREILQDHRSTKTLRIALTKRILQMLQKLGEDKEQYQKFWKLFGLILKEGPAEDPNNIHNIAQLLRFTSTRNTNPSITISLKEYVNRMDQNQEKIFYLTADSYTSAKNSPHLEIFRTNNIEVLLMTNRIDEWMMNYLTHFEGKSFHLISKEDESITRLVEKNKQKIFINNNHQNLDNFLKRVKKVLSHRVKDVRLSYRIIDYPSIVTTESQDMSTQMSKLLSAAGQEVAQIKYLLELNPQHTLVKIATKITNENLFEDLINLLFDQALLTETGTLEDPNLFIIRLNKLLTKINFISAE